MDKILLLPDNIANQIAAGEVIQRPASAVKELLENAVDAGATEVRLYLDDAGKSLIRVVDNGCGMSETDARMCFERHATSKIKSIDDLFHIKTMGFRGEALASIAAVSQVEMKTRRDEDEAGTFLEIENSRVIKQEPVAASRGTSISMKNLFFNVPARRNFLKSNASEMRHIVDEFTRVALSFPQVFFSLTHNGQQVFHLEAGSLKQRILQLLGNHYQSKLVTVNEKTDYLNIYGFVGKPDTARKTRGDQYFFVNNRFIKSAYLNHAVMNAYQEMIAPDSFPMYVLFIELDPEQVDVNVHPTKQEIKFEDEKIVYAFVQAAIRHSLAQFSITPTLDFQLDASIQQLNAIQKPFTESEQQAATTGSIFRGFTNRHQAHFIEPSTRPALEPWNNHFEAEEAAGGVQQGISFRLPKFVAPHVQVLQTYILAQTESGFLMVHQQLAHERILFERMTEAMKGRPVATQRSMFPVNLELSPADASLLVDLIADLQILGYSIEPFGKNSFVVQGTPADLELGNEKQMIDSLIEQFKHFNSEPQFSKRENLMRSAAWQQAVKPGKILSQKEMEGLISDLFSCKEPQVSPGGHKTFLNFRKEEVERMF